MIVCYCVIIETLQSVVFAIVHCDWCVSFPVISGAVSAGAVERVLWTN